MMSVKTETTNSECRYVSLMNSTRFWVHEPTDELLMGVSAVEEHRQLGLLRQVELLLKISDTEQKEGEEHKEKNK